MFINQEVKINTDKTDSPILKDRMTVLKTKNRSRIFKFTGLCRPILTKSAVSDHTPLYKWIIQHYVNSNIDIL